MTFSPTTNGVNVVVRGSLAVTEAGTGPYNLQSVNLSGSATGAPPTNPVTFSPGSLNFGSLAVGSSKTSPVVQLTNASGSPLILSSLSTTGEYTVAPSGANPCTAGLMLAAGVKCGFSVSLSAAGAGSIFGSVTVVDNAASGPTVQTYNLVGKGLLPVTLSPVSLSFPSTAVGGTSAPLQVTVKNYSAVSVTIGSIVGRADYGIVPLGPNPCGAGTIVGASGMCTFGVTFSPTIAGIISGAATTTHNAPHSPQVVALTGTEQ